MKLSLFAPKGKNDFYEQLTRDVPYDHEKQIPVIRASICTGEQVAGFRDKATGRFREATLFRSDEDKRRFMEAYGLTELKTEY